MKKFLSIFIALAMVLSLFAGVGARTAKAAMTAVTITGTATARVGAVLTAVATTPVGAVTYVWRNCATVGGTYADIVGATAVNYTPVVGDVGKFIKVVATDTTPTTMTSVATAAVLAAPAITSTAIANAAVNPTVVVTLANDVFTAAAGTVGNWTIPVAAGLTPLMATINSATAVTISFTGTAVAGTVVITAPAAILFNNSVPSNALNVVVPAPVSLIQLTISAPTLTTTKVADGTTTALVTAGVLAGVVSPDVVTVTAAANYTSNGTGTSFAGVGTGKTITVVYTLHGADAAKYIAPVTDSSVVTGAITAAPNSVAPQGTVTLTATQPNGATSVLLRWTYLPNAGDVTAFQIYRNGNPTPIAYVAAGTTTYTDAATVAGQYYTYSVTPINGALVGTPSFSVSILVTAATAATTTTSTLGLTTTGTFVGGVDGSGAAGVNGVGTVVGPIDATHYTVAVTTAAVGSFDMTSGLYTQAYRWTGATSTTSGNWAYTGIETITLDTPTSTITIVPGMKIAVDASGTMGVGRVLSVYNNTLVVNMTTAAVGVIGGKVYQVSTVKSFDTNWETVGATQSIGFSAAISPALVNGDKLVVYMAQAVPATSATAFVMVTGVPVVGDVATITWQDTLAASHSVSWTVVASDLTGTPANNVAMDLANLINSLDLTTGNVSVIDLPTGSVIQLTQDVGGVAGNGKTLTGTTTAAVVPTLTISTLGGLTQPAYVEQGKTIKLVAKDATGAVVSVTWTSSAIVNATVDTTGLVTAASVASNLTGVTVITGTSGTATGVFAVVVIPVQVITSLKINLVPAVPVSTTSQQFGAIASNATYSALDYTTQVVWTDALPVASIAAVNGLLTYSTDETGNVYAAAGGITATAAVKITTGVVTLVTVVGPVTKVVVLTIGSDIVTVDDKATTVDAAPEIVDGRTFVPIRFIAETFGSTVTWLPETKGITIVLGDTTIGLQIGNATAVINGTIIALDAAPYIKNSRTMVPLRVITESFGGNVAWDPINHIITITYVLPVVPAA